MKRCIEKIEEGNGKIPYSIVSATYPDDLFRQLLDESQGGADLLPLSIEAQRESFSIRRGLKRIIDISGALAGIILFSPLMLFTSVAVKLSSPGPIIFRQIRLGENLIRAEMLRGTKFTSAKVVRGDEVASMNYPPPGKYVFRYSLSSASGDWKASKAYRAGQGLTNPLLPISVVDTISAKSLPPTHSFCSLGQDSLVLSAIKKSDLDSSILVRVYEIEGKPVKAGVEFLGAKPAFRETNLLEEESSAQPSKVLEAGPFAIRTLKLSAKPPSK